MNLFNFIVITTVSSLVFDQTPITIEARHLKETLGRQDHLKASSTDHSVPTYPEDNLSVEHKKGNANVDRFQDDLKDTKAKNMQKTNGQEYFKTGSTNDFAPTTPGNSPGMGHKKGDDFKPTTPGHSPGVGHAFKNDEPKV